MVNVGTGCFSLSIICVWTPCPKRQVNQKAQAQNSRETLSSVSQKNDGHVESDWTRQDDLIILEQGRNWVCLGCPAFSV